MCVCRDYLNTRQPGLSRQYTVILPTNVKVEEADILPVLSYRFSLCLLPSVLYYVPTAFYKRIFAALPTINTHKVKKGTHLQQTLW